VVEFFAKHVERGGGAVTLQQICDSCAIVNNGHSGNAIMQVVDEYKQWMFIHHIEIGVAGRVRYEIEVRS